MNARSSSVLGAIMSVALVLTSCAELPRIESREVSVLANQRKLKAIHLRKHGRLAESLVEWKIVQLLIPNDMDIINELEATKAAIQKDVDKYLTAGKQAVKNHKANAAQIYFLKVLALDPVNGEALDHLREIEAAKVRNVQQARIKALLGARNSASPKKISKDKVEKYIEQDAKTNQLETKEQLAERYFKAGIRIYREDVAKAITYWKKSLSYNANHMKAKLYLEKALKMQKNLNKIERTAQ